MLIMRVNQKLYVLRMCGLTYSVSITLSSIDRFADCKNGCAQCLTYLLIMMLTTIIELRIHEDQSSTRGQLFFNTDHMIWAYIVILEKALQYLHQNKCAPRQLDVHNFSMLRIEEHSSSMHSKSLI